MADKMSNNVRMSEFPSRPLGPERHSDCLSGGTRTDFPQIKTTIKLNSASTTTRWRRSTIENSSRSVKRI